MKIIHVIHDQDPSLLLRQQGLDARLLSHSHEVETWTIRESTFSAGDERLPLRRLSKHLEDTDPDLVHFYTDRLPFNRILLASGLPSVAPVRPSRRWFAFKRNLTPARVRSPHPAMGGPDAIPEAVDSRFFDVGPPESSTPSVSGIVENDRARSFAEAVRSRIVRLRDDVDWRTTPRVPSADELTDLHVWIDFGGPTARDSYVPEALVCGLTVVTERSKLNNERLLQGKAGFLVPPDDPNEMAHVVLTALFKPEIARPRLESARQSRDRFRPSVRQSALENLYESVARSS
ncbi:MAG: hypothetical protein R3338_06700 [Thermoanaerobaculia bacterium]|nr:hypothetical protein [Thermoanaerobaculia bacterium]